MESSFHSDLEKEKKLSRFLDECYTKHLKGYHFKRISNLQEQMEGADVIFQHKKTQCSYVIDEKAQLDYANERLPTFAFELFYEKSGELKQGWLFDKRKKTDFYALVTSIFSDDKMNFTSCDITLVNRKKLIDYLENHCLSFELIKKIVMPHTGFHGKMHLDAFNPSHEGYIYFSGKNKVEKPINLIFYLDFLHRIQVAKRLV